MYKRQGGGANQLLHILLNGWGEGHFDTVGRSNLGEVAVGATVHIGDRNDVRAGSQRLKDVCCCGRAGRESKSVLGMLEGCNGLLEVIAEVMLVRCNHFTRSGETAE